MLSIPPKTQPQNQENAYSQQIAILTHQAKQSKNPEFAYQTMAVVHFKNNQPAEALDAVRLCEEWGRRNGTPLTKIYLAIFKRAEYLASTHEKENLKAAKKDLLLLNTSLLTDISEENVARIENLYNIVEDELKKNADLPENKDINDICIIPKAGYSYYGANFQRYINNIKRSASVPDELKFIDIEKFNDPASLQCMNFLSRGGEEAFKYIMIPLKHALKSLGNDDDEFLNTGFTKEKWENNLRISSKKLYELTESGKATKEICAKCYYYIGYIHNYFEYYTSGIYYFALAEGLGPNLPFNNDINNFLTKLYEMTPEERLKWIEIAISKKAEKGEIDKDLLLWKAEALCLLDQFTEAKVYAQILLGQIKKTDPEYEFVFQMANL